MKSRRTKIALAAAMSSALVLSACADGGSAGQGDGKDGGNAGSGNSQVSDKVSNNPQDRNSLEQGGTVTMAMESFPTNFNGFHVDGNLGAWSDVTRATDPGLYLYTPEGKPSPRTEYLQDMPKIEQKDGKEVITYKMNPKAVWNDGTKMDWKSFEATWKANRAPVDKEGFNNILTTGYEDIEKVEQGSTPEEVVVTMKKPFYPVTEIFGSLIHPKLGTKDAFNELMKNDVHAELRSGPFTIDKVDKQAQTIILKPNEKWWGNKPLLDQVVFRQMEDQATISAFKNGEIDMTGVANKARLQQVQGTPNMELRRSQRLSTGVYVFNTKAPSLKDVAIRKAIWQGIDREQLKQVRFNGLDYTEKPVGSALYYNFQPEAEDNMPVTFDKAAAEKTLQDAGYAKGADGFYAKDGKKATVKYTTFGDDPLSTALAQTTQNQLKAVGIDLQLDVRPSSAFGTTMEKKDFDFLSMAWSSNTNSPVGAVCQFYCSDSTSNYSATGKPELDARIKKIGAISDPAAQAKEINAIEKEWMQEFGQMPLWNGPVIAAYRQGLANFGPALYTTVTPKWEDVGWMKGSTHN
ncbi:ABC transporter family substrate-binding protein [Mobilicoccus pelagius]|uniref:Putative peptide ABC transporter substrate-binding protein n=1 Tax=Mobilicoccus pelagius NBRC 104925 TaxID=1089455 RepID=H5UTZ9_9MICO|nr:ABC transporter family substrate-binding protein [Mobilicoccus pelagius]GAB49207.1 putative peptide ABC transporter substrate-binding protein [Mobilicoccus pelagius NBRC 104925]